MTNATDQWEIALFDVSPQCRRDGVVRKWSRRSRNRTTGVATAESSSSYGLALLALVVSFFAIGARWLWLYRRGQPLDIDEAHYLGIALSNYHAFVDDGVDGWLSSVLAPGIQGPLTTALASLLFSGTGPHVIAGFAVPLLAGTGCVIATYFLGKSVASREIGLGAGILVASCPVILSFSRSFHFSLPAAVVCTVMLMALVKSERFERIGWSALFGVTLGLMPLARTMTIAFMPGAVAAAAVYALADPASRVRRMLVLSASLALAALTAAIWLVPNGRRVYEYLFSFGYGARAVEYEAAGSESAWDAWLNTLRALCNHDVYLPHLLVMLVGGVATMVVAWTRLLGARRLSLLQIVRAPVAPIVILIAEALLALTSSRNQSGSAFFAPIVPAAMVVTVWACLSLSTHRNYQRTLRVLAAVVAVTASAPLVDLRSGFARPWWTDVPILGGVVVTDGRGTFQDYAAGGNLGSVDVAESIDRTTGAAWLKLDRDTAAAITRANGATTEIAFGFRHRLHNVNTVNLQQALSTGARFGTRQVEPTVTGDSVQGYVSWLAGEGATACVLLTSDSDRGQFEPVVNPDRIREAAERAGFTPMERRPTPDGQVITIWRHRVVPPHCGGLTRDSAARLSMAEVERRLVSVPLAGIIDVVGSVAGNVSIAGWAADHANKSPAVAIHVFVNGSDVLAVAPDIYRPDINQLFGAASQNLFGFAIVIAPLEGGAHFRLFSQLHDGSFAEIKPAGR